MSRSVNYWCLNSQWRSQPNRRLVFRLNGSGIDNTIIAKVISEVDRGVGDGDGSRIHL